MSNAPAYFFFLNYFVAFFSLWAAKRSSVVAVLTAAKQTSIWSLHRVFLFWFSIAVAVKDAITLENNWQDLLPRVWFVVGSGKTKHSNGRRGSNLRSFRDCRSVRCHIFLSHLASLLGGLDVRMDRCLPRYWLLRALSVDKPSASFPGMTVRWFRTFPAWSAFIGIFFFVCFFFFRACAVGIAPTRFLCSLALFTNPNVLRKSSIGATMPCFERGWTSSKTHYVKEKRCRSLLPYRAPMHTPPRQSSLGLEEAGLERSESCSALCVYIPPDCSARANESRVDVWPLHRVGIDVSLYRLTLQMSTMTQ